MKSLSTNELRQTFLDFFAENGHAIISSASLIPENDPTVLFTTAGMHPLVPYLMGQKHPLGKRLAGVQKCLRTGDIDEVGDATHLTFFEMLGNWSLGDYFKENAIEYSFEFLTGEKYLAIDPNDLYVSVFAGDADAPRDDDSIKAWLEQFKKAGIDAKFDTALADGGKIFLYPKAKNWWGPVGNVGPCGPDTEMFYDTKQTELHDASKFGDACHPNCECGRFVEIWNDVFMEYNKNEDGKYMPLAQKNVDTGLGLQRVSSVLQGVKSVYEIDQFLPTMSALNSFSNRERRILADHTLAIVFILADGVLPANEDAGYVLRRLIRRALDIAKDFDLKAILQIWIDQFRDLEYYPSVGRNVDKILALYDEEKIKYQNVLREGPAYIQKIKEKNRALSGEDIFFLRTTLGIPTKTIIELSKQADLKIQESAEAEVETKFIEHQAKSREGAAKKFAGGLAGHSEMEIKYHTASHLMHQALRMVLGNHVMQRGSNITPERLRFDFTHPTKMTPEEITKVEEIVNDNIKKDWPINFTEMTLDEAKNSGALGFFEHKYGDRVTVYTIGNSPDDYFSKEICGGPHAIHTGELGYFKITKEEASSAGVRRIKAVLE